MKERALTHSGGGGWGGGFPTETYIVHNYTELETGSGPTRALVPVNWYICSFSTPSVTTRHMDLSINNSQLNKYRNQL